MHAKRETREQARSLRRQGHSVRDIARQLSVSKASVSTWVRDIELTQAQINALHNNQRVNKGQTAGALTNKLRALEVRKGYQEAGRAAALQMRPLHMAGCMLYWAEGAKRRNTLIFVNSDPHMMQFFIKFLREELHTPDSMITLSAQCHSSEPEVHEAIRQYWSELLGLPTTCFRKIHVKQGGDVRPTKLMYGLARIEVHSSQLTQHIYGAIQEYAGFDNPDWLF